MYSINLDENKYFTGSFASIGKVDGGIDIDTLPPTDNNIKARFYKYDNTDSTSAQQIPMINEATGKQEIDELGNLLYHEQLVTTSVLDWIFDNEKYQQFLIDESNKIIEPTLEEKVITLQSENELLKGCIMELTSIVYK